MNSFKVVTVCSSDAGHFNMWRDSFIPDRRGLTKDQRKLISQGKPRIQSAGFSGVLRPVTFSELRNNFPSLIKQKRCSGLQRSASVDSEVLRKEIKSAVLLLESRNERDMIPRNNDDSYNTGKYLDDCHYKIHDRHRLSQSAQRMIEKRVQSDACRWKSAKSVESKSSEKSSKKCNLRMLLPEDISVSSLDHFQIKASVKDRPYRISSKMIEPKFIISNSNSLTNFITIDDISGIKDSWCQERHKPTNVWKDQQPEPIITEEEKNTIEINEEAQPQKRRENVLREYMEVYMRWRTVNAIDEHRSLVSGRSIHTKSGHIRNATPKQRLEQFEKIVNESHNSIEKDFPSLKLNIERSVSPLTVITASEDHLTESKSTTNKFVEIEAEITDAPTVITKEASVIIQHPVDEDTQSEVYSEIDWLECEEIF